MRETGIWCILKLDQCHYTSYHSGTKLLRETYGSTVLDFFYDANGTPVAMKQNGAVYYYVTNLQGDVVRLVNSAGSTAAYYKYDPYGNATTASGSHATINPLRYRGYYYDTETGLYYCQSRYYDPAIGRWINADSFVSTGQGVIGHNMFAYCGNNPVNMTDPLGLIPFYEDPLTKAIEEFIQWYRESDEDEVDDDGNLTLNAKLKRSVQTVIDNFVFSAGVGLGIHGGVIATENVSADAGIYYDLLRIQYYNGKLEIFEYGYQGIEISFLFFNLGDSEERQREISNKPSQWQITESPDALPVWGISGYLFGGGSIAIGFDINSAIHDLIKLWE